MKNLWSRIWEVGLILLAGNLLAQPIITNPPVNQTVVWGSNATFSVGVSGTGPFTYQWQMNGTNLPNNIISTVVGGNLFNNQQATNTILNRAMGTAVDAKGNLYIADTRNHVIRKVGTNGIATIIAGNGSGSISGDGAAATNAGLSSPNSVILDVNGNLFIADTGNNRIRKVNTNGIITTFAGNGTSGFAGDGGAATNAQLSFPTCVCLDTNQNLIIADNGNNRIRKVDANGNISTIAGGGGSTYGVAPNTATSISLNAPNWVAVDSTNNIFIADSSNNKIGKLAGGNISAVVNSSGTRGYSGNGGAAKNATTSFPSGIAVDTAGNLYVVDIGNFCVRKVDTNNIITTVAGNGTNGFSGDGGKATNANLSYPNSASVDANGNLFISDAYNNRVRKVDANGIITTAAGRILNDGDNATNATLNVVSGIAFDTLGNLYIADTYNNRIRKVDTNGIITTVAGNGVYAFSGDGGAATNANLKGASGVAVDPQGNLFIADSSNYRIRKVDTNGNIMTYAGSGSGSGFYSFGVATNAAMGNCYSLAIDAGGNVIGADFFNSYLFKVSTNGTISSILGTYCFAVALDSSGRIYVAYNYAENVRRFNSFIGVGQVIAGQNGGTYGVGGFSGDGGQATSALLNSPQGVAVDAIGNCFISDTVNFRIRTVKTNGIITTIVGNGVRGFSGDGGSGNNATISSPNGMAVSSTGDLYFADTGNNRIRKLSYVEYADQPTFTVPNVTPGSSSNNYSVVITSAAGSVTSSVVAVNVQLPPITPAFTVSNGVYSLSWSAISNLTYQLQYATNLLAPVWTDLGSPVTATSNSVSTTDALGMDGQRFYRVRLWP